MGNIKKIGWILLLFSLGCGHQLKDVLKDGRGGKNPKGEGVGEYFFGQATSLNGNVFNLSTNHDKHRIIIFSQDTCLVCGEEAHQMSKYFTIHGLPLTTQITTLLVESDLQDAKDWVDYYGVQWKVGVASYDLFRKYCPQNQVPCILIETKEEGIVFNHTGAVSIEKMQEYTGSWY